ncbi:DUF1203 domain-containing protein [Methylobacterium phyllosphaerae]
MRPFGTGLTALSGGARMTRFLCVAVPTETADKFRSTRLDDRGNAVREVVATASGRFPAGIVCSWRGPERPCWDPTICPGPSASTGHRARFSLHAGDCPRRETVDEIAPIVRANPLVSIRAYDGDDQCLYDLGHVCAGEDVEDPLRSALDDPRTRFVNVHTARPGCLLSLVVRLPD